MSNLIDFDDDDFFAKGEESLSATSKDLDEIFGTAKTSESSNLEDIFGKDESKKKPLSEKQLEDLFGKDDNDEFDFFAKGGGDADKTKEESQAATKPPAGFDDSFALLVKTNSDQSDTPVLSHDQSDAKTPDLDSLLNAQPAGMLDSTDDLLIFDPFTELPKKPNSPVMNPKVKKSTELKIDPADDFFADAPLSPKSVEPEPSPPPLDTQVKMESESHDQAVGETKPKRSMERSFEDLLHGLSDESDPDLDDLITHDTECSTNLESIIPSPDKGHTSEDTDKEFGTPDKNLDPSISMDIMTSTPNVGHSEPSVMENTLNDEVEQEVPEVRVETPEGIVVSPDSDEDEQDLKEWEMVDKEDVEEGGDTEEKDDVVDDDDDDDDVYDQEGDVNNSGINDVIMRRRKPERSRGEINGPNTEDSVDLSAIEESNQLDVDISKHKSELSKRGSLALRRKPSRKNRRSLIDTGEDAIYKDSTRPRAQSLPNGEGELFHPRDADLSPPPKRPSPGFMMPLPGMAATRPPRLSTGSPDPRLSTGSPDDDSEMVSEPRRLSKPPPGAFRLPAVVPRASRSPAKDSSKEDSQPSVFSKPSLRSTNRIPHSSKTYEPPSLKSVPRSRDIGRRGSEERDTTFETPSLKSVSRADRKAVSEERDMTFEKPRLRSTPKPDIGKNDTRNGELGANVKPSLRSTPSNVFNIDAQKEGTHSSKFETPSRRDTPKRTPYDKKSDYEKHSFDKPDWRSRNRGMDEDVKEKGTSSRTYSFEDADYTGSDNSKIQSSENEKINMYEKPTLRSTPAKVQSEKRDGEYTFTKPVLRKSPEKETKESNIESKGYFDKPLLRKTENKYSEGKTQTSSSEKDYSSNFPEMKLRKTERTLSESKGKVSEKPEWLQAAKSKQSKALDVIQSKENYNGTSGNSSLAWLKKSANQVPLQETSQNRASSVSSDRTESQSSRSDSRSRRSSMDSTEGESSKGRDNKQVRDNNYTPSWMRQGRSPSTPGFGGITPAKSCPSITDGEVPQWKKDLVQRRQNRKNSQSETPKKEESPEPEWKNNIQLRKLRPTPGPVKEVTTAEPEWKKAAEEKKARLRRSALFETSDSTIV